MPSIRSIKSSESTGSAGSIGMGTGQQLLSDTVSFPHLLAEGVVPTCSSIFDCVVFIFYCPMHDCIALHKGRAVWFPFVAMPGAGTWEQAAKDGVAILIGKRDSELDQKLQAGKLPDYTMTTLHVLRVQLPDRFFVRFTQFVQINRTPGFECCPTSGSLVWTSVADIVNEKVANVWGPEVKLFTSLCQNPEQIFIHEYSLDTALKYVGNSRSSKAKWLTEAKIQTEEVKMIYEDYVDHCFPAFYMSIKSFETYLIKYGFKEDDARIENFFKTLSRRKNYLDFEDFLFAIVGLEEGNKRNGVHYRLIFKYYDRDWDENLSQEEFMVLLADLHPSASPDDLTDYLDVVREVMRFEDQKTNFAAFYETVANQRAEPLKNISKLCLAPKAMLSQIQAASGLRAEQRTNAGKSTNLNSVRGNRGPCATCRAQNYEFNLHSVFFDTDGRCMMPVRIDENFVFSPGDHKMTAYRYSAEHVFKMNSSCNTFIDVIRDLHNKGDTNVLQDTQERTNFLSCVQSVCDHISAFLIAEPRLNHITGPAIVIGSIFGNLDSLMKIETNFWRGKPVIPENLVFLGNYFGPTKFNVEVITYLFSLKMLAPNKVFLLRGASELRNVNQNDLLPECLNKYGKEVGTQIWKLFNDVLDKLAFAMLIDESILCVPSGIPKTSVRVCDFEKIPKEVKNVETESPLAFELLHNTPKIFKSLSSDNATVSEDNFFCEGTFNSFMKLNELQFLIRGNELAPEGGKFYFDGRCISVCSAETPESRAGVIFIDRTNSIIRFVRLENLDKS